MAVGSRGPVRAYLGGGVGAGVERIGIKVGDDLMVIDSMDVVGSALAPNVIERPVGAVLAEVAVAEG